MIFTYLLLDQSTKCNPVVYQELELSIPYDSTLLKCRKKQGRSKECNANTLLKNRGYSLIHVLSCT